MLAASHAEARTNKSLYVHCGVGFRIEDQMTQPYNVGALYPYATHPSVVYEPYKRLGFILGSIRETP